MKELTIEYKAKAYDEAYKKVAVRFGSNVADEIFLKESEDERIRKAIIKMIADIAGGFPFEKYGIKKKDALAWLGKQGEQNTDDLVEPKFKVGDWVVSPNGVYWHIDAINNNRYEVSSTDGACADWPLYTDLYNLWTIQDAKDGDVLSYRNGQWIFIYKEKIDDSSFYYHALYSTIHQDLTINDAGFTLLGDAIIPATKEQRDLLFQKMKESGYEWDAEKLELRKIEQKHAEVSKQEDTELTEFEDALYTTFSDTWQEYMLGKEINVVDFVREHSDELLKIANKQKPTEWSEEDERLRKEIVNYLECQKEEEPTRKDKINSWISWILKHSFSEWTKEEKEAWNKRLDCIIDILDWAEEKGRISLSDCQDYSIMLKSLRPQNTWKPSDEQIDALEDAIADSVSSIQKNMLNSLYQDIKKLREE